MSFASVAALLIFLLVVAAVIFLVLRPVSNRRVTVSYAYVPVLGVFLSLLAGSLSLANVRNGIVGDENIRPYGILILFMSLAYQSGSLDMTGVFAWYGSAPAGRRARSPCRRRDYVSPSALLTCC